MRSFLVIFFAVLLIAFVDALRKANITKPVVKLEQRPPPVWNRPPEERRKLSIFPKNNMKFVVTPKSVEKNEDAAKGLPTKRPLMRKFTMQDRNEKGTWSFAPREPLMKINRFTVTSAPPKSSNRNEIDEISEKSNKVHTVISRPNIEQPSSKNHNLNEGNLIEMMLDKKEVKDPALKTLEKVEEEIVGEEFSEIIKVNDTQDFDIIQMNDNSTFKFDKASEDSTSKYDEVSIETQRLNHENDLNANETKHENGSVKLNQTAVTLETASTDLLKSRTVDLNELKYAIKQNESNMLTMDDEESTSQILRFNDHEILSEKNVTNTEFSAAYSNGNNSSNTQKIETEVDDFLNKSVIKNENFAIVEIPNEAFIETVPVDEVSNKPTSDTSNGEEISNESSSIMTIDELSNESSSLVAKISNESIIGTSNNTDGEIFNESSSIKAGEEISNESYLDKSNNLTEETSNEYTMETSNTFIGEEMSNESSSNMAAEEISIESDKSYNLTGEISGESTIETHNLSDEEISDIIDEMTSDRSVGGSQEPEFAEEALTNRFKRSNNIIEEENSPTTVSGSKYTGTEVRLNHDLSYKNINA